LLIFHSGGGPRRRLRRAYVEQQAVGVAEPQAVGGRFLRRIEQARPALLRARLDLPDGVRTRAEADVMHVSFPALDEDHLVLVAPVAAHDDPLAVVARLHAEIGIELLARGGIGHGEGDVLQRADGH
jgi:hypothetical protein